MQSDTVIIAGVGFFTATISLFLALGDNRKQRLLDDTPISKALGVFIGEVELVGKCVRKDPPLSYLAGKPCVQYRWNIIEHWERITVKFSSKGIPYPSTERGSELVASGGGAVGFYLQDETGVVWIEPKGAELTSRVIFSEFIHRDEKMYYAKGPAEEVGGSTGYRTFTEHALPIGTTLFIRGRASERPDAVAAQIKYDEREEMFIITDKKEAELSLRMGFLSTWLNFAGATAAFLSVLVLFAGPSPVFASIFGFLDMVLGKKHSTEMFNRGLDGVHGYVFVSLLLGVGLYHLTRGLFWSWMAFNSMIGLRNRVAQAYSLIDVQLKRRKDLIERFVVCVKGFREHEASVQTLLAAARAQVGGDPLKALAPGILAVIESYPEIRAQGLFNDLSKQLIETEDRIALARGYHNNIATFYNTRLERIPDSYLANFVKMKPEPLFEAEGFTYHPSAVAF